MKFALTKKCCLNIHTHIYIYIYIERERERERGIFGVMVIIIGNENDDWSSNPGHDCFHFLYRSLICIHIKLWINSRAD